MKIQQEGGPINATAYREQLDVGSSNKRANLINIEANQTIEALDAGGRARNVSAMVQALALAKEAGVDAGEALSLVNWGQD